MCVWLSIKLTHYVIRWNCIYQPVLWKHWSQFSHLGCKYLNDLSTKKSTVKIISYSYRFLCATMYCGGGDFLCQNWRFGGFLKKKATNGKKSYDNISVWQRQVCPQFTQRSEKVLLSSDFSTEKQPNVAFFTIVWFFFSQSLGRIFGNVYSIK